MHNYRHSSSFMFLNHFSLEQKKEEEETIQNIIQIALGSLQIWYVVFTTGGGRKWMVQGGWGGVVAGAIEQTINSLHWPSSRTRCLPKRTGNNDLSRHLSLSLSLVSSATSSVPYLAVPTLYASRNCIFHHHVVLPFLQQSG